MKLFKITKDACINPAFITAIRVQEGKEIGLPYSQRYNTHHVVYMADGQKFVLESKSEAEKISRLLLMFEVVSVEEWEEQL